MTLRNSLTDAVRRLDPEGSDPGLKQMVVIGHSQGGLLTKMTVVSTGSKLYDAAFTKPIDQLNVSEETRDIVRRVMFVEPLPFVKQVVFICTPHRGSFLAAHEFATELLRRIVSTPARLVKGTAEVLQSGEALAATQGGNPMPTAVDNMSPRHPFVKTLSIIPIDPGVAAYSIIAVKGNGPIETGDDGVVKYESAHIDGVQSELVVRWEHSVEGVLLHTRVNPGSPPLSWKVLLSGYTPDYAYDLGRLDTTHPFLELERMSKVNERAHAADNDRAFSQRLREGLPMPPSQ